jgi:hypothetical protein
MVAKVGSKKSKARSWEITTALVFFILYNPNIENQKYSKINHKLSL